jgi:hypothetical protein
MVLFDRIRAVMQVEALVVPPDDDEPDPLTFYIMKLLGYDDQYDWIFTKDQINVDFKDEAEAFDLHLKESKAVMILDGAKKYHGVHMLFVSIFILLFIFEQSTYGSKDLIKWFQKRIKISKTGFLTFTNPIIESCEGPKAPKDLKLWN